MPPLLPCTFALVLLMMMLMMVLMMIVDDLEKGFSFASLLSRFLGFLGLFGFHGCPYRAL